VKGVVDVSLNNRYFTILVLLSMIRAVLYMYWYFLFSDFSAPIYITEIGNFLYLQLPLVLITLDLVLIIIFLVTKGKTWNLLVIGSLAALPQAVFLLFPIDTVLGILGIPIITISCLQIVAVLVLSILRLSPAPLSEEES
jgi:hypothetical protein